MRGLIPRLILVALFLGAVTWVFAADSGADSPLQVQDILVGGVPFNVTIDAPEYNSVPFSFMVVGDGEVIYTHKGIIPADIRNVRVPATGEYQLVLNTAGESWERNVRALHGLWTLLPPLLAILVALLFRQVYVALFAGVWIGGFIILDFNPLAAFFYVIEHYAVNALAGDGDHVAIAIFTLMLGGMVGIFTRSGGTTGIVHKVSKLATNARRGQLATWLMGILIFFDDYTNTLIVGNTMRPITDRLRISREKLSYLVDSTAAPVACIAVITSWIGFEISLLKDAFTSVGMIDRNPFMTFVASVPYSYYPIFTLLFGFMIARTNRDFGPMLRAERRARETGEVLAPGATPISNIDTEVTTREDVPPRSLNAVIPILVVVFGTVLGLIITGRSSLLEGGATNVGWFDALKDGNSFVALLWSSMAGCTVALIMATLGRTLSLTESVNAWVAGVKSMFPAIIILLLAWGIGAVCTDLHTADYLVGKLSGVLAPELLPCLIFLVAGTVAFATGTSWGTMTILIPLSVPLVIQVTALNDIPGSGQESILLSSIAAILSGAVFGDHCSPISDTTIMSSMASTADHVDHVRTQLPYALTVAATSVLLGYLPFALGLPLPVVLLVAALATVLIVRFVGKPTELPS